MFRWCISFIMFLASSFPTSIASPNTPRATSLRGAVETQIMNMTKDARENATKQDVAYVHNPSLLGRHAAPTPSPTTYVGLYCGGKCSGEQTTAEIIQDLTTSGVNEVVFASGMINLDSSKHFFKSLSIGWDYDIVNVSSDGSNYQINEEFRRVVEEMTSSAGTSITHVSFTLGSAPLKEDDGRYHAVAYEHMQAIMENEGSQFCAPGSQLYRAFQTLFEHIPHLRSVVLDIEDYYEHPQMITTFSNMIGSLQRRVVPCPYQSKSFWQEIVSGMEEPSTIQEIHLQAYDGGAGNLPSGWNFAPGITVNPGFSVYKTQVSPSGFRQNMSSAKIDAADSGVPLSGGWIWDYEGISSDEEKTLKEYVDAIKEGMEG